MDLQNRLGSEALVWGGWSLRSSIGFSSGYRTGHCNSENYDDFLAAHVTRQVGLSAERSLKLGAIPDSQ